MPPTYNLGKYSHHLYHTIVDFLTFDYVALRWGVHTIREIEARPSGYKAHARTYRSKNGIVIWQWYLLWEIQVSTQVSAQGSWSEYSLESSATKHIVRITKAII